MARTASASILSIDLSSDLRATVPPSGDRGRTPPPPVGETYCGGWGADTIHGSAADDLIVGNASANSFIPDNDTLFGGNGDDIIYVGGKADGEYADGGAGNDILYGADGADTLHGGEGHDQIRGGYGNDLLYGGQGDDFINGQEGNDVIYGGDGNDHLNGGYAGFDRLYGGAGKDTFEVELYAKTHIMDFNRAEGDKIDLRGITSFHDTPPLFSVATVNTGAGVYKGILIEFPGGYGFVANITHIEASDLLM